MLTCSHLTIGYEGNPVLSDLSFSVERGDYLCILGENGAGKSTLMKTLLGLIPPLSGEMDTSKSLGYLPQQTARQKDFPATVREIVISGALAGCGLRPFYNKEEKQRAKEAMERLGLTSLAHRSYRELSGGQQERVLLARALCTSAELLLLDEPTAGLDPEITNQLYDLFLELNQEQGVTLMVISHDISASLRHANKILSLGKEVFFGTKEDYIHWKEG